MLVDQMRAAVKACPLTGLDALAREVWRAFGADAVSEAEASELCELVAARRAPAAAAPRRSTGSRPRSGASIERRRAWTAGGWLPPALAARFTMGEAAAVAAIVAEIAAQGACELHVGAIAARAGVSDSTVRNGRRQAVRLGLLTMVENRHGYDRSGPNRITILSRDLALWVRTRARAEVIGGRVQDRAADLQSSSKASLSRATPAPPSRVWRWETRGKRGISLRTPHAAPTGPAERDRGAMVN